MSDLLSRCKLFNALAPVQTLGEAYAVIQGMETVDAVEVVRCKDCKNYRYYPYPGSGIDGFCLSSDWCKRLMNMNDFCSRGERKDGEHGKTD